MGISASTASKIRTFFLGMGFISSSAAIHSMVILERSIGHRYLHGYNAGMKFMSAKVLVSLAFLQWLVNDLLSFFSLLSETRQKLLYASTMCFECFLISIFHLTAWSARERWFRDSELLSERRVDQTWNRRAKTKKLNGFRFLHDSGLPQA